MRDNVKYYNYIINIEYKIKFKLNISNIILYFIKTKICDF